MRLFAEMADPLLKHPLIHIVRRTDADEGMPEHMPALHLVPLRFFDQTLEVIVGFIASQGPKSNGAPSSSRLAAADFRLLAEKKLPAGMDLQPVSQHTLEE